MWAIVLFAVDTARRTPGAIFTVKWMADMLGARYSVKALSGEFCLRVKLWGFDWRSSIQPMARCVVGPDGSRASWPDEANFGTA